MRILLLLFFLPMFFCGCALRQEIVTLNGISNLYDHDGQEFTTGGASFPFVYHHRPMHTYASSVGSRWPWLPTLWTEQRVPRSPVGAMYLEQMDSDFKLPVSAQYEVGFRDRPLRKSMTRIDRQYFNFWGCYLIGTETRRVKGQPKADRSDQEDARETQASRRFLDQGRLVRETKILVFKVRSEHIPFPRVFLQPEEERAISSLDEKERLRRVKTLRDGSSSPDWFKTAVRESKNNQRYRMTYDFPEALRSGGLLPHSGIAFIQFVEAEPGIDGAKPE